MTDDFQACPGVTSILDAARRAEARGKHQQARDLYSEVTWTGGPCLNLPGSYADDLDDETDGFAQRDMHPFDGRPSARDGFSGRPTTRDAGRPGTQDGTSRRPQGAQASRPQTQASRPQTRDSSMRFGDSDRRQSSLDGVRPSTRDEKRVQQLINGNGSSTGNGSTRGQDVPIRQVTGRRRKHGERHGSSGPGQDRSFAQQVPEVLFLDNIAGPPGTMPGSTRGISPSTGQRLRSSSPGAPWVASGGLELGGSPVLDADDSVELLE